MTVYDASRSTTGIDYVDRLPAAVKAVVFTTADGQTTRVPTTPDGFVQFAYSGEVPDSYSKVDDSPGRRWLTRITYLDQDGRPRAATNTGTSEPDQKRVGELPLLDEYPSLRGDMVP